MERGELRACVVPALRAVTFGIALLAMRGTGVAHPDLEFVQGAVDEMLLANPNDADLLMRQGSLREEARDWDGALVSFAHALAHGADPDAVAVARARVFLAAGFPRTAKLEYDTLLAKRPDAFDVLFERGRAHLALGQLDAADDDFSRAIAHMKAPRPEHVIVRSQALVAAGKRVEAVQALDAGIARLGPLASLQLSAVDLDVELERYDGALARLDILLKETPTNAAWITRRAEILQRAGRSDEARAEAARALHQIESRPVRKRNRATKELADRLRIQLTPETAPREGNL